MREEEPPEEDEEIDAEPFAALEGNFAVSCAATSRLFELELLPPPAPFSSRLFRNSCSSSHPSSSFFVAFTCGFLTISS